MRHNCNINVIKHVQRQKKVEVKVEKYLIKNRSGKIKKRKSGKNIKTVTI